MIFLYSYLEMVDPNHFQLGREDAGWEKPEGVFSSFPPPKTKISWLPSVTLFYPEREKEIKYLDQKPM